MKMEYYFNQMIVWGIKLWKLSSRGDFGDLPFEYEQRLFTKLPIYSLTNNIVESFKVS